ncbi:MAG: PilZ domain-containing protein [Cycloclasticus sp.]|nr:PilZ domain-containing protein [Cycloclasticus sp.]
MLEPSNHRKFDRISAECDMDFTHPSTGVKGSAHSINLSAAGILFRTRDKLTQGEALSISVKPVNPITPPLNAIIEIVRVVPVDGDEYEVAATIEGIKGV